jgi:hypothetical protein
VTPQRVQLRRSAGWRKPESAIVVARSTRWGNPFPARDCGSPAEAVRMYHEYLADVRPDLVADARRELAARDLACWCPLDQPCHADVLLRPAAGGDP